MIEEKFVYHVIKSDEWQNISRLENYEPESLSKEGYIHFSLHDQIAGVIDRYYKNQEHLIILKIDVNKIKSKLKFERVADREAFPHLYGLLNLDSVVGIYPITKDDNNQVSWDEN